MTFDHPAALALLAAVPLAWWLWRRPSSPAVLRVASLLPFRAAPAQAPSRPRRAVDLRLAAVLAALTLLALSGAGPALGETRPASIFVVVDDSASMSARTCDAVSRAETLLARAVPGAVRDVRPLGSAGGADGLPGSLAPHLEAARAAGHAGLVLVTDALVPPLRDVAVVGPSRGARANVSVAGAALEGGRLVVGVRNHGSEPTRVRVEVGDASAAEAVVAPGAVANLDAGAAGSQSAVRAVAPEDDFAGDDAVLVRRTGGARAVRIVAPGGAPRTEAALRAIGVRIVGEGDASDARVLVRPGPTTAPDRPAIVFVPGTESRSGSVRLVAAGAGTVTGDAVAGSPEFAGVLPAPPTRLVASGRLDGGASVWEDASGVLVASEERAVVLALDPEDAGSDWHLDPSFPVLLAASLDRLCGGPDRIEVLARCPAAESEVVHEPPATAGDDAIRALVRPAGPGPRARRPARWLAAAAALLLLFAAIRR